MYASIYVYEHISSPKEQNSFVDVAAFTIKKQYVYITNACICTHAHIGNNHRYICIHCMLLYTYIIYYT